MEELEKNKPRVVAVVLAGTQDTHFRSCSWVFLSGECRTWVLTFPHHHGQLLWLACSLKAGNVKVLSRLHHRGDYGWSSLCQSDYCLPNMSNVEAEKVLFQYFPWPRYNGSPKRCSNAMASMFACLPGDHRFVYPLRWISNTGLDSQLNPS